MVRLPRALTNRSFHTLIRPVTIALVLLVAAFTIAGCGLDARKTLSGVSQDELSSGGEPYFNVGPITYQVQESRQLNPFLTEDVQFLAGVQGAQNLPGDEFYFGVFLWAKNQTKQEQTTTNRFRLVDSSGGVYYPVPLNPSINPYAWSAQKLVPNGIQPDPDSTAAQGFAGGDLILFKLNESAYSNRPLTLDIYAPGATKPSTVSLDL